MLSFKDPVSNPAFIIDVPAGVLAIPASSVCSVRLFSPVLLLTFSLIFVIGNVLCGFSAVPSHNLARYLRCGQTTINGKASIRARSVCIREKSSLVEMKKILNKTVKNRFQVAVIE